MTAHDGYSTFLNSLDEAGESPSSRVVQRMDNTLAENPNARPEGAEFVDVDALFGKSPAYVKIQREKPQHRMILWLTLQTNKPKEIAAALRITPQTVYNVMGQPWFQEAFTRLSSELGSSSTTKFLEGAVLPALQRVENLARTAEQESVKLAANQDLINRFLGKATTKLEVKSETRVENVVYDVEKLKEERRRLQEQLKNRGVGGAN